MENDKFYKYIENLSWESFDQSPIHFLVTIKILNSFLDKMSELQKDILMTKLNDNSNPWIGFTPPLVWVILRTNDDPILKTKHSLKNTTLVQNNKIKPLSVLNQEEGIELFDLLVSMGARLYVEDQYGRSVVDYICNYNMNSAFYMQMNNNLTFLKYVKNKHT